MSAIYCIPGPDNSNLINTEKAVPTNPAKSAYIKYNTPMSLAFDDKNHLSNHMLITDVFMLRLAYVVSLDNTMCLPDILSVGVGQGVTNINGINVVTYYGYEYGYGYSTVAKKINFTTLFIYSFFRTGCSDKRSIF